MSSTQAPPRGLPNPLTVGALVPVPSVPLLPLGSPPGFWRSLSFPPPFALALCSPRLWNWASTVVELNVGGHLFTTTVGTLHRVPGSKLAAMLSGLGPACVDAAGRLFIDRPGTHFGPVLDYLRSGHVPTQHMPEVYREAQFYELQPLVQLLEDTPQLFGEHVSRKQFMLQVPNYGENLELLLRLARAEAVGKRHSSVVVCLTLSEQVAVRCIEPLGTLEAQKMPVVKFESCNPDICGHDLLHCLDLDIQARGYQASHRQYPFERAAKAKVEECFHVFTFTWW
ncbi:BTB/POZ domain-containing protein KCTD14 [Ctenodactylus gundi]